jgi:hypothetical protein
MNYQEAFEILEIDFTKISYTEINLKYLKHQYRMLALKHHPDKNGNTESSNEDFKKINEAYHYLKREIGESEEINDEGTTDEGVTPEEEIDSSSLYFNILRIFIRTFFNENYNNSSDVLIKLANDIIISGKKITHKLFYKIDKEIVYSIYTFLSTYRTTLHLSDDIINTLRNIVVQKYDEVEVYKLNPSINDLLNNNVYKLVVENEVYLVPLWHHECYFDSSGCEIIVVCEPELPVYITIDEDNNICVEKEIVKEELSDLFLDDAQIEINIGNKQVSVLFSQLYIKREQYYKIKNEGLSKIKSDIYDVSEKTDIIIHITIK